MPTAGIINGKLLRLYIADVAVSKATECTLSISVGTRGSSHKDSGGWEDSLSSIKSWTMSTSALYALDSTNSPQSIAAAVLAGTPVAVRFTTDVTGDTYYSGTGIITKFDVNAPNEEDSTFSIEIKGSGALTIGTEA